MAPTIFSQEHLQTSGKPIALKNWRMFSPSSLFSASPIITSQSFTNLKHVVLHIGVVHCLCIANGFSLVYLMHFFFHSPECNDSARSSCGLNLLLTAAALVDGELTVKHISRLFPLRYH